MTHDTPDEKERQEATANWRGAASNMSHLYEMNTAHAPAGASLTTLLETKHHTSPTTKQRCQPSKGVVTVNLLS